MSAKSAAPPLTLSQHTKNAKKRAKAPPVQRRPLPAIHSIPKEKIVQVVHRSVVAGEAPRTYAFCMMKDGEIETRAATIGEIVDQDKPSEHLEVISFISLKTLLSEYPLDKILERCNRRGDWSDCSSAFIPDNELWNMVCEQQHLPDWAEPVKDFRDFMFAMEKQWCAKHAITNLHLEATLVPLMGKSYATPTPYYEPATADRGKTEEAKEGSNEESKKPAEKTAKEQPAKAEPKKEEKSKPAKEEKKVEPVREEKKKKKTKKEVVVEDVMEDVQEEVIEVEEEEEEDREPPRKKKRSQPVEQRQESPPKRTKAELEQTKAPLKSILKKDQPTASLQPKIQLPKEGFESTFTSTHVYHFVTTNLAKKSQKHKAKVAVLNTEEVVGHLRVYSDNPGRQKCLVLFLAMLEAIALGDSEIPFMHIPIPGHNSFTREISTCTTGEFKTTIDMLYKEVAELAKRTKQRQTEENTLFDKIVQVSTQHGIVTCLRNIHQYAQLKYFWLMYTTAAAIGFPSEDQVTEFAKETELLPELRGLYRSLEPKAK